MFDVHFSFFSCGSLACLSQNSWRAMLTQALFLFFLFRTIGISLYRFISVSFFSFPSFPSRFIPVCCWTASDVLFAPSICLPAGSLTCVFSYFSPCPMRRTSRKKEASILRKKKDKLRRKFQKLPTDIPCLTLSGAVRIFVLQRSLSSFFFFPPFRSLSRLFLSLAFSVGCGGATLGPGIGG